MIMSDGTKPKARNKKGTSFGEESLSGGNHKGCMTRIVDAGFENLGYLNKKAAHGDMSRLGGRGILIFKKHSTGELKHTMPPCGMSSVFFSFF